MSCGRFEKWIALSAEGDLAERKARRLEAHLAACGACRELAESLAASQAALKGLRAEAVDVRTLEQVRRNVLEEIAAAQRAPRSWIWLAWRYVLAGALIAVASGTLWWRSHRPAPVRPVVARAPVVTSQPPEGPGPAPAPANVAARPQKHRRSVAGRTAPAPATVAVATTRPEGHRPSASLPKAVTPRRPPAESEPLLVKLETADPNVVIYLLVDQNGG